MSSVVYIWGEVAGGGVKSVCWGEGGENHSILRSSYLRNVCFRSSFVFARKIKSCFVCFILRLSCCVIMGESIVSSSSSIVCLGLPLVSLGLSFLSFQ